MKTFLAISLISVLTGTAVHAQEPPDSLAYSQKRKQILGSHPDERHTLILGAADDLARDGYFPEALDLIYGLDDSAATAKLQRDFFSDNSSILALPALPAPTRVIGYVQSSMDYEDWDGLGKALGGKVRGKLEWTPPSIHIDRMMAIFQGSDNNAYFDFSGKGSGFNRMFKVESEGLVEKKLWQTYGDSLDRVFIQARVEANTRPLARPLSLVVPIRVEAEQFRTDRFGSLSSRSIWAAPGLESISDDLRKSLNLSWELKSSSYPNAVATGNFRQGPVVWGEWYGDRISADLETRYQTYDYVRDTSLYLQRELETRLSFFVRTGSWLKVGMRSVGATEYDDYRDSVYLKSLNRVNAEYRLQGSTWSLQPQLVGEWNQTYTFTVATIYSRGSYPVLTQINGQELELSKYLDVPYEDWRPSLGLTILAKTIFLNLSFDYQTNTVPYNPIYSFGSSRGMGVNGNMFWKIRNWFEIDFTCMAEHRLGKTEQAGRIQDMTSLSLGITSRFP